MLGDHPWLEVIRKPLKMVQQLIVVEIISWAGSSAWLERSADNRKVESSNLSRPIFLSARAFRVTFVSKNEKDIQRQVGYAKR
jgi:hypothetical protein